LAGALRVCIVVSRSRAARRAFSSCPAWVDDGAETVRGADAIDRGLGRVTVVLECFPLAVLDARRATSLLEGSVLLAREVAAGEKEGSVLRPLAQELGAEGKLASEDEEAGV
jgi:hypothetical protein